MRAGVVITPYLPGVFDAVPDDFIEMVDNYTQYKSSPLLADLLPFVQAIAARRAKSSEPGRPKLADAATR